MRHAYVTVEACVLAAGNMSQSDRSAQLLSQKLIQGWTMLAESCANRETQCNVVDNLGSL